MAITKATSAGFASNKYNNVSADNYYMEPITKTLVGSGGVASVTFDNIPQGYRHLQIRGIGRASTGQSGTSPADMFMTLNGDNSASYVRHRLTGDGSTTATATLTGQTKIFWSSILARSTGTSNAFGSFIINILDYQNINKFKTLRLLGGADLNGAGVISMQSALWMNTAPITSMTFTFETDSNSTPIAQHSRIALYGIRG
jgi:hypothetical protein